MGLLLQVTVKLPLIMAQSIHPMRGTTPLERPYPMFCNPMSSVILIS